MIRQEAIAPLLHPPMTDIPNPTILPLLKVHSLLPPSLTPLPILPRIKTDKILHRIKIHNNSSHPHQIKIPTPTLSTKTLADKIPPKIQIPTHPIRILQTSSPQPTTGSSQGRPPPHSPATTVHTEIKRVLVMGSHSAIGGNG